MSINLVLYKLTAMSRSTASEISEMNAVRYAIPCPVDPISDRKALLDAIVANLQADRIIAAYLDANHFTVYLCSLEDVSALLQLKNVKFQDHSLLASHPVNAFTLCNVPPSFTREEMQKVLVIYGHVVHVDALPFCSGVPQYDHILGSERRVFLKVLPDMINVDLLEKLTHRLRNYGIEKIAVYKHCVICKKDGHSYDTCSKIDGFNSQAVLPESSGISSTVDVAKEEANASNGEDSLEQVDKLLDHNYISRPEGEDNKSDSDSVISLSDAFEYVSNVTTLAVRPKSEVEDTSADEEKKETPVEDSGSDSSTSSSNSSSPSSSDSSSEEVNIKAGVKRSLRSSPRSSVKKKSKKFICSSDSLASPES